MIESDIPDSRLAEILFRLALDLELFDTRGSNRPLAVLAVVSVDVYCICVLLRGVTIDNPATGMTGAKMHNLHKTAHSGAQVLTNLRVVRREYYQIRMLEEVGWARSRDCQQTAFESVGISHLDRVDGFESLSKADCSIAIAQVKVTALECLDHSCRKSRDLLHVCKHVERSELIDVLGAEIKIAVVYVVDHNSD